MVCIILVIRILKLQEHLLTLPSGLYSFTDFVAVLPKIIVSYIVGLGIEFAWAQWKHEEIQEGYLVSGILIPMILPVNCPIWIMIIAIAFAVIFAKEIFGGTGMNIFNVALIARAFLFFSYPSKMSGDSVWVANDTILGFGNKLADGITCATPLDRLPSMSLYLFTERHVYRFHPLVQSVRRASLP